MSKTSSGLSRWLRTERRIPHVLDGFSGSRCCWNKCQTHQAPSSKFRSVAATALPHHLRLRRHSNRDVTSQYFPMKACVAKQLTVRSGKIQGCFLADESNVCVCAWTWRICLCIEPIRNPPPPLAHTFRMENSLLEAQGSSGRADCVCSASTGGYLGFVLNIDEAARSWSQPFVSPPSHKDWSLHIAPAKSPHCVRAIVCVHIHEQGALSKPAACLNGQHLGLRLNLSII